MNDTQQPLKARLRVPGGGGEILLTIDEGEEVIAGLSLTEAEEFGVVLHNAVAAHLRERR